MQLVHKKLPQLKCIIAGGGKLYFDYSKYANSDFLFLQNKYIDTENLVDLLSKSLFSVCPYTDATQSGVIYSCFALKKPVIASNVGALSDAVINGVTGLLVEPKNSKALAEAIVKLASDCKMREDMATNIKNLFFVGDNSWNAIAQNNLRIYKS